jgi:hypothetical protein
MRIYLITLIICGIMLIHNYAQNELPSVLRIRPTACYLPTNLSLLNPSQIKAKFSLQQIRATYHVLK